MIKPATWSEERWELYLEESRSDRQIHGTSDEVDREARHDYLEFMDGYDPRSEL